MKVMAQADLARLVVRGRGAHIATALTTMGWSKGPALTILAKCEAGQIEGSRYEAIGGLKGVEIPLINLDGETKDGIDMGMLGICTCAGAGWAGSIWCCGGG